MKWFFPYTKYIPVYVQFLLFNVCNARIVLITPPFIYTFSNKTFLWNKHYLSETLNSFKRMQCILNKLIV